ncbi:MAG: peptidoglycan DD-metalloendopeptidase family protein [Hahellaceae bacterium]|nr:peptidoglycan DD-metalloendopeptidase family protein [Hahellaceae bacterium]MCP5168521.1 peptidoglycan DD-metalloendopeptidase family protein [Hahellaceae bacterium]
MTSQHPLEQLIISYMQLFKNFPKTHILAASGLGLSLGVTLMFSPSSDVEANRTVIPLSISSTSLEPMEIAPVSTSSLPDYDALPLKIDTSALNSEIEKSDSDIHTDIHTDIPAVLPATESDSQPSLAPESSDSDIADNESWAQFEVKNGDTLSAMFAKAGFDNTLMYEVLNASKQNKDLTNLYVGEKIAFLSKDGSLEKIKLERSLLESFVVYKNATGKFESSVEARTPDAQLAYTEGKIESSLFLAGQKVGLSESLIMELANIFAWDIDFALDIREGDTFGLVYEEHLLDGKKIGNGRIIAATFTNQGSEYQAVYYVDSKGNGNYYTPDGDSMRKAFLRTPIDFARVSSPFNLSRKHPVLHTIRAHKGTDYAASTGTPIKATGDGKVIHAGRKGGYGKAVIIQHGDGITTLYAHMSKYAKGMRVGQKIRQGQIIGYVGSTGLASGPHLHYEFRKNGVHKNPMTVKLPQARPISNQELARFKSQTKQQLAQLKTLQESYHVASSQ